MVSRRDRVVLLTSALVVAAWLVAEALTGRRTGLLFLALALVLVLRWCWVAKRERATHSRTQAQPAADIGSGVQAGAAAATSPQSRDRGGVPMSP
jgi:Flp pilus assembly protein TadB